MRIFILILFLVEGRKPIPKIYMPFPEFEDTTSIKIYYKMPNSYFYIKSGNSLLGNFFELNTLKYFDINNNFGASGVISQDRSNIELNLFNRQIFSNFINEFNPNIGIYKINNKKNKFFIADNRLSYYGLGVLNLFNRLMYEDEFIYDISLYKVLNQYFKLGINAPIISPYISIKYNKLSVLYKSKRVVENFSSLYMNNKYIRYNKNLQHEYYPKYFELNFVHNIIDFKFIYKKIRQGVMFNHYFSTKEITPMNFKYNDLDAFSFVLLLGDKNYTLGFDFNYREEANIEVSIPEINYYPAEPKILFISSIELPFIFGTKVKLANKYTDIGYDITPYFLTSVALSKAINNFYLWFNMDNIFNKEYEIIKKVKEKGIYFQFNIKMEYE